MQNTTFGIYVITEKATGKMYVGLSGARDGIEGRWNSRDHRSRFPRSRFTYEILHPLPPGTTRAELSLLEKFYIKELDCMEPNGFNRTSGGCGKTEISAESKKRRSEIMKGKNKGRVPPNKGKPLSEEQKDKLSAANKGQVPPNKGKPLSEEQRAKISAAKKGVPISEETRAKRKGKPAHNKGKPGKPWTEEQREKTVAALKGRVAHNKGKPSSKKGKPQGPLTEEQKKRQSENLKAIWALKRAAKAAAVSSLEALLNLEFLEELPSLSQQTG